MNIAQIFTEIAEVAVDVEVDGAELAAGVNVQIPLEPQVGTTQGKPIYLIGTLSTTKAQNFPSPVTASGANEIAAAAKVVAPNTPPVAATE